MPFEKIAMLYRELVAKNKEITALNKESVALDRHEYNLDVHGPTGSGQGVSGSAGGKGQGGEVIQSPHALPPDYPKGERTIVDGQSVKYDKVEPITITNHKPISLQELVPEQPYLRDGVTPNAKFKGPWWVISDNGSRFQTYKRPRHWPLLPGEGIDGSTSSTPGNMPPEGSMPPTGPTPVPVSGQPGPPSEWPWVPIGKPIPPLPTGGVSGPDTTKYPITGGPGGLEGTGIGAGTSQPPPGVPNPNTTPRREM